MSRKPRNVLVVFLRGKAGAGLNEFYRVANSWGCSIVESGHGVSYVSDDALPALTRERLKEQIILSLKRKKLICARGIDILKGETL